MQPYKGVADVIGSHDVFDEYIVYKNRWCLIADHAKNWKETGFPKT